MHARLLKVHFRDEWQPSVWHNGEFPFGDLQQWCFRKLGVPIQYQLFFDCHGPLFGYADFQRANLDSIMLKDARSLVKKDLNAAMHLLENRSEELLQQKKVLAEVLNDGTAAIEGLLSSLTLSN